MTGFKHLFATASLALASLQNLSASPDQTPWCQDCIDSNYHYMSKTTSFELSYPPKQALRLFTAEGERYWVESWAPTYIRGNGYNKNDLFIVDSYDGQPFYIVLDFDDELFNVSYSEIIPNVTAGTLHISLTPIADQRSLVTLNYNLSALSDDGRSYIKDFGRNYEAVMLTWKQDIETNKAAIDAWLNTQDND